MSKRIITNDVFIKKLVIEDISKIYIHFHKDDNLRDVIKMVTYQSRTDEGLKKMIDMAKKMVKRTYDRKIQLHIQSIDFLMGFYKKGAKK